MASIVHIQDAHASSAGAASVMVPLAASVTSGNFLAAAICLPSTASVASVTDNHSRRWIRNAYSYNSSGNAELWTCRGARQGSASVTCTFTSAGSVGVNVSEWSNVWWVDPEDQWSQTFATSSSITPQTITPRGAGDLVISVGSSNAASVGAPTGGFTTLTESGSTGYAAAYQILSGSVASNMHWPTTGASVTWAGIQAAFVPGATLPNPNLQFPETLVEMSTTGNFMAPLEGTGIWTNITSYVRSMNLGPLGRQHELDRIQATSSSFIVNNRSGAFNSWNDLSFLYNGGNGLQPMNPMKVTAAWNGVTSPITYTYIQSLTPRITDVLNVDMDIECMDVMQMMSLKYLANNNYAQLIITDGGANLAAYYRCGDQVGSFTVLDSSGNGNDGSLIDGNGGSPVYGAVGAFLYDPNTALDATNGTNVPNGGFQTTDLTTQPPTYNNPLGSASVWSVELWVKFTGATTTIPTDTSNSNMVLFSAYAPAGIVAGTLYLAAGVGYDINFQPLPNRVLIIVPGNPLDLPGYSSLNTQVFNGQWHHIVITQDISTTFTVYIDGIVDEGFPVGVTLGDYDDLNAITFGVDPGRNNGFAGLIQDCALYTTALTAEQVASHYAIGLWFQSQELGAANGDETVARFNKVLAVAGLDPTIVLDVPYPFKTELYGESNVVTTTSALNYLQTISESEPGLIFQSPTGSLLAYGRQYQYLNPTSVTSQAIIGDSTGTTIHYEGTSLQIVNDDLDTWNDVQVQSGKAGSILQTWGPEQSAAAATSASAYGDRTLQGLTSLQQEYDSDALALAQNYAAWYNVPLERVTQIVLNSVGNGGSGIPQMLQRGIYDRVTVQYQGQTAGPQFAQDSLIEQITHSVVIDGGPLWSVSWALSPYEILLDPIVLDSSELDGPDVLTL